MWWVVDMESGMGDLSKFHICDHKLYKMAYNSIGNWLGLDLLSKMAMKGPYSLWMTLLTWRFPI